MRTKTIALIPETPDLPGFDSTCATGSLISRVLRNALELEAVDPPMRVVSCHFLEARIDHGGDVRHRQRGFRNVRGDDDSPARRCRRKRCVLLGTAERPVQRHHVHVEAAEF